MELRSQPKWIHSGSHRVIAPEETVRRVRKHMKRIGVTRVADTTGLDTLGLPVFSAIRPTDAGMDGISVYNGKGLTKAESLAGALMEAIERYCAEFWTRPRHSGTYEEIVERFLGHRVLDPERLYLIKNAFRNDRYERDMELEWGEGWDLLYQRPVLAPLNAIMCPYRAPTERLWYQSSNGLASGNTLEEAVCHALAELIERDAYTIAMVRSQLAPRVRAMIEALTNGNAPPDYAEPDRSLFPSIDLSTLPPVLDHLVKRIRRDGTEVWLREITSDLGIPAFVASMRLEYSTGEELLAGGFGCHPNAVLAAIRALTEAAQGRNVQIQGVREDIKPTGVRNTKHQAAQRVLSLTDSTVWIPFDEVPSYEHDDILDDITLMLGRLEAAGVTEVYAVDVSLDDIPARVVRLIIPDLECWFLTDFKPNTCNLGQRAQRYLPQAVGVA